MFHCEWGGYRASSSHCDGLCGPPRKNQDFWPPGTPIETSWYQAGPGVRWTNGWPGWATTSLTFACASMKGKSLSDPDNYPSMNTMLTSRSFMSFTVATGTAINVGWLPKSSRSKLATVHWVLEPHAAKREENGVEDEIPGAFSRPECHVYKRMSVVSPRNIKLSIIKTILDKHFLGHSGKKQMQTWLLQESRPF